MHNIFRHKSNFYGMYMSYYGESELILYDITGPLPSFLRLSKFVAKGEDCPRLSVIYFKSCGRFCKEHLHV